MKTLEEIKNFLVFFIEELPDVLTLLAIPALFSLLLTIQKFSVYLSLIITIILGIYLFVKSRRFLGEKKMTPVWKMMITIISIALFFLEVVVIAVLQATIKISLLK